MKEFTKDEIKEALKSMSLLKASGKDEFPTLFYQKFRHVVGDKVLEFCLEVLNRKRTIECINNTSIVLLPKVHQPTKITQFRSISLCNVLYKIIAKVIVNCFLSLLNGCIDEAQPAFISGRKITNNNLIVCEILHSLKIKKKRWPKRPICSKARHEQSLQ